MTLPEFLTLTEFFATTIFSVKVMHDCISIFYICSNRIDLFSLCSRSLQQKKPVTAETFESVTVYFSDIHDFSTLTAESTPLEVQFVIQISEVMVIS